MPRVALPHPSATACCRSLSAGRRCADDQAWCGVALAKIRSCVFLPSRVQDHLRADRRRQGGHGGQAAPRGGEGASGGWVGARGRGACGWGCAGWGAGGEGEGEGPWRGFAHGVCLACPCCCPLPQAPPTRPPPRWLNAPRPRPRPPLPTRPRRTLQGNAVVRAVFGSGKKKVAGCAVTDGKLVRAGGHVTVKRGKTVVYDGKISSLRRVKVGRGGVLGGGGGGGVSPRAGAHGLRAPPAAARCRARAPSPLALLTCRPHASTRNPPPQPATSTSPPPRPPNQTLQP